MAKKLNASEFRIGENPKYKILKAVDVTEDCPRRRKKYNQFIFVYTKGYGCHFVEPQGKKLVILFSVDRLVHDADKNIRTHVLDFWARNMGLSKENLWVIIKKHAPKLR